MNEGQLQPLLRSAVASFKMVVELAKGMRPWSGFANAPPRRHTQGIFVRPSSLECRCPISPSKTFSNIAARPESDA